MKIEDYNPKAREAFGKSLIDIGVAIYKGLILLFTVIPISILLKFSLDGSHQEISIITPFENMSSVTYLTLMGFMVVAFFLGHFFRSAGLKHIHELEDKNHNKYVMFARKNTRAGRLPRCSSRLIHRRYN